MDKKIMKGALATIWALTYRSIQGLFSWDDEEKLVLAINTLQKNWDANDRNFGMAQRVCDNARMMLAAIQAIPRRKPFGRETLMEDCQYLQHYLGDLN